MLEETLPLLRCSSVVLREELQLIFSLVETDRMVKAPDQLLKEAVQSYAYDRRLPDMFTRTPKVFRSFLRNGKVTSELKARLLHETRRRHELVERITPVTERSKAEVKELAVKTNVSRESWHEMQEAAAPRVLELVSEQYGVRRQCLERGLSGLLENQTVRMFVIYYLAWCRAKLFGEGGPPGKARPSELGDWFHSVQSSAADIFVTEDSALARWLKQVSDDRFEVIGLEELIERLF